MRPLPILQAALNFVAGWEQKKVNKTIELEELVDYLGYFREAGGVIPLEARESENAVRLMTAHGVKGLEFPHVFILRANPPAFPASYKETLVAFPRELRDPDSATEADDKTLHEQEERRLKSMYRSQRERGTRCISMRSREPARPIKLRPDTCAN